MGSGEGRTHWSVFEGLRSIASSTPETLMAEIDTAIGKLEYSRATAFLDSLSPTPTNTSKTSMSSDSGANPQYDVKMADGAYRAGCASLAAGKLDEALQYLNVSLSKCPPDKTSAVAKLHNSRNCPLDSFIFVGCLNAFPTSRAIIWPNLLGDVGTRGREQRKWEKQRAINISNMCAMFFSLALSLLVVSTSGSDIELALELFCIWNLNEMMDPFRCIVLYRDLESI
ncbi:hypothetical protein NC652_032377 [Populus alba x Populus x berolinensis]|nr:hypothetical protein NC652_032377 [Populus alba x Populus x berolinensis]